MLYKDTICGDACNTIACYVRYTIATRHAMSSTTTSCDVDNLVNPSHATTRWLRIRLLPLDRPCSRLRAGERSRSARHAADSEDRMAGPRDADARWSVSSQGAPLRGCAPPRTMRDHWRREASAAHSPRFGRPCVAGFGLQEDGMYAGCHVGTVLGP